MCNFFFVSVNFEEKNAMPKLTNGLLQFIIHFNEAIEDSDNLLK